MWQRFEHKDKHNYNFLAISSGDDIPTKARTGRPAPATCAARGASTGMRYAAGGAGADKGGGSGSVYGDEMYVYERNKPGYILGPPPFPQQPSGTTTGYNASQFGCAAAGESGRGAGYGSLEEDSD